MSVLHKQHIKAVFFDVGGVLTNRAVVPICEELSIALRRSFADVIRAVNNSVSLLETGTIDEGTFSRLVASELRVDLPAKYEHFWVELYRKHLRRKEKTLDLAARLRDAGYQTGAISNGAQVHMRINYARGIYDGLEPLVISYEVGSVKPGRKIYEIAIERMGLPTPRCVFIDDTEENLVTAGELGMRTILFRNVTNLESHLRELEVRPTKEKKHRSDK